MNKKFAPEELEEAVESLPEKPAEAWKSFHGIEGEKKSRKEIAKALGVGVCRVQQLITLAKRLIHERLNRKRIETTPKDREIAQKAQAAALKLPIAYEIHTKIWVEGLWENASSDIRKLFEEVPTRLLKLTFGQPITLVNGEKGWCLEKGIELTTHRELLIRNTYRPHNARKALAQVAKTLRSQEETQPFGPTLHTATYYSRVFNPATDNSEYKQWQKQKYPWLKEVTMDNAHITEKPTEIHEQEGKITQATWEFLEVGLLRIGPTGAEIWCCTENLDEMKAFTVYITQKLR